MAYKQKIKKNKKKYNFGQIGKVEKARNLLNKFLFTLTIICGISFIVCVNDISIKGFVLEELKADARELRKENKNIELVIMKLESFDNIAKRAEEIKMVKVDKIDYISINSDGVAMR